MIEAFLGVVELSPEVSAVEVPPYPPLCPEMTNTEMDLPIWRVLLGLLALRKMPPVEIFGGLLHPLLLRIVCSHPNNG